LLAALRFAPELLATSASLRALFTLDFLHLNVIIDLMGRRLLCLTVAIFLIGQAGCTKKRPDDVRTRILELEANWENGMRNNDVNVLDKVMANDWRIISGKAEVVSKNQTLSALRSGTLKFESVTFHDVEVWTYPGVAVAIGRAQIAGKVRGQWFEEAFIFTDLFIPRDGEWRSVFTQVTYIPRKGTDNREAANPLPP
jgi:Domain of unknown function (DUF4440)